MANKLNFKMVDAAILDFVKSQIWR